MTGWSFAKQPNTDQSKIKSQLDNTNHDVDNHKIFWKSGAPRSMTARTPHRYLVTLSSSKRTTHYSYISVSLPTSSSASLPLSNRTKDNNSHSMPQTQESHIGATPSFHFLRTHVQGHLLVMNLSIHTNILCIYHRFEYRLRNN